jgi:hypothetical protein
MSRFRSLDLPRPRRDALVALLLGASLAGCGPGQGEVSGVVRVNGRPLPFGTIQFLGPDGVPRAGKIRPDGTFSVGVPPGEAKVIVSCVDEARLSRSAATPAGRGRRAAPPPSPSGGFSLIPGRYADWDASGLKVVVRPGKTVQDFALTPN